MGSVENTAKSLDLVRNLLQKFINKDIDIIIQKYVAVICTSLTTTALSADTAPLCLQSSWCYIYILTNFLPTSLSLLFDQLNPVGLALDVVN